MGAKRQKIRRQVRTTGQDPHYFASCYGKLRRNKDEAYTKAEGDSTMSAYKCQHCQWYHVGHKPKAKR